MPSSRLPTEPLRNGYLYGGAGNDTLRGTPNDDVLLGGIGNDWLYGGRGNDILHGGGDNDVLKGGEGNDMYFLGLGDIMEDSDGIGQIWFSGKLLTGGSRDDSPRHAGREVYFSATDGLYYEKRGQDLAVWNQGAQGTQYEGVIKNFQNGQLGIYLHNVPQQQQSIPPNKDNKQDWHQGNAWQRLLEAARAGNLTQAVNEYAQSDYGRGRAPEFERRIAAAKPAAPHTQEQHEETVIVQKRGRTL
ncbi:calcium-binding protein [Conchiformibius kuhniae]|uniref:calcium-binding protein n=1 Tax=Conchiformibius kuhniae TaxID=211502 RepID=UPI0009FFD226|nr:hypothetical protein [Conchiformibius kuhniae]